MDKRIVAVIVILIILLALVIGAVYILKNKQTSIEVEEKKMNEISSENINSDENKQKVLNSTSFNFETLRYATITPAIIQNENHLYYQNTELQEYVKKYGIIIESWYPFGGRGHTLEHFNNSAIKELATKYNKTSA